MREWVLNSERTKAVLTFQCWIAREWKEQRKHNVIYNTKLMVMMIMMMLLLTRSKIFPLIHAFDFSSSSISSIHPCIHPSVLYISFSNSFTQINHAFLWIRFEWKQSIIDNIINKTTEHRRFENWTARAQCSRRNFLRTKWNRYTT